MPMMCAFHIYPSRPTITAYHIYGAWKTTLLYLVLCHHTLSSANSQSNIYKVYADYTEISSSTLEWAGWSRDPVECGMKRMNTGGHGNSYFSFTPVSSERGRCRLGRADTLLSGTAYTAKTYRSSTITSAAEYMTTETPAISFSCTDPEVDSVSTGTCNDPKFIRTVKAAMGLHSNRGVVFLDDGDYIYCSGMNDFTFNYGSTCTLGTLYNDVILDPTGAFPEGPDAAAEFITSSTTDVRYYLFLGSNVYCYTHQNSMPYFIPCSEWIQQSILERFGDGIPDNIDAAIGVKEEWTFHFTKGNLVYTSSGDSLSGTMDQESPVSIQMWHPKAPCDTNALMPGMTTDDYFFYKGTDQYFSPSVDTLEHRSQICR